MEEAFLDIIRTVYVAISWPGVVLLMAIESACIPFPSELIMPFAGWFLVKDAGLGLEWVFVLALFGALGNLLGSLVAYAVGAWGGRPFLESYGKYLLISHRDLAIADEWFAKRGEWIVLVSRLLPVVRTFISLPAGIARMNIWRFSIFTLVGAYPFCLGLAYGGYKLGEHWEDLRNAMRPFDIPIGIALVALAALYVWRHVRQLRKAPKGATGPEK
jgi:membrane protein DedA with SNARE-associated domain